MTFQRRQSSRKKDIISNWAVRIMDNIDKLIKDLGSNNWKWREAAISAISQMPIDPSLLKRITDLLFVDCLYTSESAAEILERITNPPAIPELIRAIEKHNLSLATPITFSQALVDTVRAHPKDRHVLDNLPKFRNQLEHPESHVRIAAAKISAITKDIEAIPLLQEGMLDDTDTQARIAAIEALGKLRDYTHFMNIIENRSEREGVRMFAINELVKRDSTEDVEKLLQLLSWKNKEIQNIIISGIKEKIAEVDSPEKLKQIGDAISSFLGDKAKLDELNKNNDHISLQLQSMREKIKNILAFFNMIGKDTEGATKFLLNQHQTDRIDIISRAIFICDVGYLLDNLKKVISESFGKLDWRRTDTKDSSQIIRNAAQVTDLLQRLEKKKNSLVKNRGILLDDKPKPPRKGIMYKTARRAILR
jgi:HEAT repeat protein